MTMRAPRRVERTRRRRSCAADATIEPDPGPAPEAVFDRITGPFGGPYGHRSALAMPGARECDEEP
jgi:hypothetical protein